MSREEKILYTIGHSNIAIEEFLKLVREYKIETLVDVRSSPYSRYASQFNKERLMLTLTANGIRYIFLGNSLGGIPKNKSKVKWWKMPSISERRKLFEEGIQKLIDVLSQYRTAIMCAEENPMKCHRRHKIGAEIYRRGIKVKHIRGTGILEGDSFKELVQGSLSLDN